MYSKVRYFHSLSVETVPNLLQGNICCQIKAVLPKEHCKDIQPKSVFSTILIEENVLGIKISCSQQRCSTCNLSQIW